MKWLSQKTKINAKCLHKGKRKWRNTLYYSNSEFLQTKKRQPQVQRLRRHHPRFLGRNWGPGFLHCPEGSQSLWNLLKDSSSHASISLIQAAFSMLYSFSFRHWSFQLSLSLLQTQSLLLICSSLTSQNLALCWVYELSMWTDQINKGSTLTGRIARSSQSQEGQTYNKRRFWNFRLIRTVFFPVDLVGLLNLTSWNMLTDFENTLKIKLRD